MHFSIKVLVSQNFAGNSMYINGYHVGSASDRVTVEEATFRTSFVEISADKLRVTGQVFRTFLPDRPN